MWRLLNWRGREEETRKTKKRKKKLLSLYNHFFPYFSYLIFYHQTRQFLTSTYQLLQNFFHQFLLPSYSLPFPIVVVVLHPLLQTISQSTKPYLQNPRQLIHFLPQSFQQLLNTAVRCQICVIVLLHPSSLRQGTGTLLHVAPVTTGPARFLVTLDLVGQAPYTRWCIQLAIASCNLNK